MLNMDYDLGKNFSKQDKGSAQTCAVPGRNIRDGLARIYNIINYVNDQDLDGLMLSIDHKSAFDIVEWEYLFLVLKYFDLGKGFLHLIKAIYSPEKTNSVVQVNGFLSEPFIVSCGIRQDCPLSPLLSSSSQVPI